MANSPNKHKNRNELDPEVLERVELQGADAIAKFGQDLIALGIRDKADYQFKAVDREDLHKIQTAAFAMIGGIPAFSVWASQNPTDFYKLFYASINNTGHLVNVNQNGQGGLTIITGIPESNLDDSVLDVQGKIIDGEG